MADDIVVLNQKVRIFLSDEQKDLITKCFGMSRFYFNKSIEWLKKNHPEVFEKKYDRSKDAILKKASTLATTYFRKQYHDLVLTTPAIIINPSIKRFIRALKEILFKKGKTLRFRSKKHDKQSVTFERKNDYSFKIKDDILTITRLRDIKFKGKLRYNGKIKQVTISKVGNRYYATICMEVPRSQIHTHPKTERSIGLDWGMKTYLSGWDGCKAKVFDIRDSILKKHDNRINKKQKKLSCKKYRSKMYFKVKDEVALAYFKKSNFIYESIKKMVYEIVRDYDKVILEDLCMKDMIRGMPKNARHARANKPFFIFKNFLEYKLNLHDKELVLVPKNFPSTQTCSNCGYVKTKDEKMTLKDRIYVCHECGYTDDRDTNAAKNLYSYK